MLRIIQCMRIGLYCAALELLVPGTGFAHISWTRSNDVDPACLALYHISDNATSAGNIIAVPAGLPAGRGLVIPVTTVPLQVTTDTAAGCLSPYGLLLDGPATLDSADTLTTLSGDLTVEGWLRWDPALTSSSVQLGLRSGAKLVIARDSGAPGNDRFGLSGTHGSYVSAPGFTNWTAVGTEEAPVGEWLHFAVTIHSTGQHFNPTLAHDVYSTGSVARFFLNGHYAGTSPFTVNLLDFQVHDASRLRIQNVSGRVSVDEVTVWNWDWSGNGAVPSPFHDGRGTPAASVENWLWYRD